jgi:nudix-type nucleoside diphosphatase (YffH/AdpP family)
MIRELEEETGYRTRSLDQHQAIYMSPGSFSERIHLFTGSYNQQDQSSKGGGNPDEGEDIEIVHLHFGEALGMIDTGDISDAKTIILLQQFAIKNRMR